MSWETYGMNAFNNAYILITVITSTTIGFVGGMLAQRMLNRIHSKRRQQLESAPTAPPTGPVNSQG